MVKSFAAMRKKSRTPRRRRPNSRRTTIFPPIIPFDKVIMNVVTRHVYEYSEYPKNSVFNGSLSIKSILNGPWSKLRDCFSQLWILKVHMYAVTGAGLNEPGYHLINLAPSDEFSYTDQTKFSTLASLPGTETSRIATTVSSVWYPTGMDERRWFETDNQLTLMQYIYQTAGQRSKGQGKTEVETFPVTFTFDCHVKLRGVNNAMLKRRVEGDEFGAKFVNLTT